MSTCLLLFVEIELPDDVSEEYQDAIVEDLTYEPHMERLENGIKRWVRFLTGEACHITITVDNE